MPQPTRPVIALNMDYIPAGKTAGPQLRLHAGYCDAVYAAGGLPLIIPPVMKEAELDTLLERVDGVILTGCPLDLDPKRMGLAPHPAVTPMPARREDMDRMLGKLVLRRQLPCLGVAVGMHVLNVLSGGSQFLHLPEDQPRAMPHKDLTGGPHRHTVLLEPNTRLDAIYGGGEIRVNSYHHQGIHQVASGFRVSAKAPDGVIEAIEAEDPNWFCIGVQWHPHSETASALDMQLFEAFVHACVQKEVALYQAA